MKWKLIFTLDYKQKAFILKPCTQICTNIVINIICIGYWKSIYLLLKKIPKPPKLNLNCVFYLGSAAKVLPQFTINSIKDI